VSDKRVYLIDASIYIFRAWFSLPDRWHTGDGMPLNAVYGYTGFLLEFFERVGLDSRVAVAFDESLGSCFRNDIYPDYKSSRALPDEALAFQLESCRAVTELVGLGCFGGPRFEADDYIAALAALANTDGQLVTVVTRDKDLGQILSRPGDQWWDFAADVCLDSTGFQQRFGVQPSQFADYLALVGDPVDDIPGVKGVGPKTAAAILEHFDDLAALGGSLDKVAELPIRGAAKVAERLGTEWSQVMLARKLTGLAESVPEVEELPPPGIPPVGFRRLAAQLSEWGLPKTLQARCLRLAA